MCLLVAHQSICIHQRLLQWAATAAAVCNGPLTQPNNLVTRLGADSLEQTIHRLSAHAGRLNDQQAHSQQARLSACMTAFATYDDLQTNGAAVLANNIALIRAKHASPAGNDFRHLCCMPGCTVYAIHKVQHQHEGKDDGKAHQGQLAERHHQHTASQDTGGHQDRDQGHHKAHLGLVDLHLNKTTRALLITAQPACALNRAG